jgi:hypothetical protein
MYWSSLSQGGNHQGKFPQHRLIQAITGFWPFDLTFYEPCLLETFKMLADRGLGQGQQFHYIAAETAVNIFQIGNYHYPGRVPEGFAHGSKMLGIMCLGNLRQYPFVLCFHFPAIMKKHYWGAVPKNLQPHFDILPSSFIYDIR